MKRNKRLAGGFTLFELILSTTVAAMIALALFASLNVAVRAWRSTHAAVDPTRDALLAAELIAREFESVPPPGGILSGALVGIDEVMVDGRVSRVSLHNFAHTLPHGENEPLFDGLQRVELSLEGSGDTAVLVKYVQRTLLATAEPRLERQVICRDVRSFSLRYYASGTWYDTWDSTEQDNTLPVAVEITIERSLPREGAAASGLAAAPVVRARRIVPLSTAAEVSFDASVSEEPS